MTVVPPPYLEGMTATVELVGVPLADLAPGSALYWCVQVGAERRHFVRANDVDGAPTGQFWNAGPCGRFAHPVAGDGANGR